MVYTFAELKRQVLVKLDEVGAESTEEIVGNEINNAHVAICNERPWPWMADRPRTITTRVGIREITLPPYTQRLLYLRNVTQAGAPVIEVSPRQFSALKPMLDSMSGPASRYVRWGLWPVARQPAAATLLRLVSDNALDTGSTYDVAIKGLDAEGNERAIVITPQGTTPVDATVQLEDVELVVKTQEWNGNLTLKDGDGNTLLTLFPWEMGRQYQVLYLLHEPTAAEELECRVDRQPLLLVNTYDVPMIPGGEALVLVYETLMQMSTYLRDLNPNDVGLWRDKREELKRNLYSQLLGDDLQADQEEVHTPDDGWDDTF